MSLVARYEAELESGILKPDGSQLLVVRRLDAIATELTRRRAWRQPSKSVFASWFEPTRSTVTGVNGLYVWGGVGRGKTHLCDLFFDSLQFEDKTRFHFHRFMQKIHTDLRALDGIDEPLQHIAESWADRARLLLLDEIHVNDITDAMLLGGLLTELFKRGVTLVTTSNVPPDDLYRDGLQRARFLPAIAQLNQYTTVIELDGKTDYRLRLMQTEPIYILTSGQSGIDAQQAMQAHFDRLHVEKARTSVTIKVSGRDVAVLARAGDVVWFDFDTLCNTPRSTHDYIEIASVFQTVLISSIPVLNESRNDEARRFVNLIDEFYDRNVKLIISAEAPPDGLYVGEKLAFEFVRAASRLFEMQTTEYLAQGRAYGS